MINNNNDADFPEKIFSLPIMKKNADIYIKTRFGKKLNEKETRYIYVFFVYGGYNLMREWLNGENTEPYGKLADTIITLLNGFRL